MLIKMIHIGKYSVFEGPDIDRNMITEGGG